MPNVFSESRIWMFVAITCMATSFALSIYLIYDKGLLDGGSDNSTSKAFTNRTVILAKYPFYFRTVEEQAAVERTYKRVYSYRNITWVEADQIFRPQRCIYHCPYQNETDDPSRGKRSSARRRLVGGGFFQDHEGPAVPGQNEERSFLSLQWVAAQSKEHSLVKRTAQRNSNAFHGCCISSRGFTSPDYAMDADGRTVEVVQFQNERQYFPTERCRYNRNCSGCTCGQETALNQAVVKIQGQITLEFIEIPGCCKCFNNAKLL